MTSLRHPAEMISLGARSRHCTANHISYRSIALPRLHRHRICSHQSDIGSGPSPEASLSSLDSLLGPQLQQNNPLALPGSSPAALSAAAAQQQWREQAALRDAAAFDRVGVREPPVSTTDLTDLVEPRGRPDISTAIYYLVLVVRAAARGCPLRFSQSRGAVLLRRQRAPRFEAATAVRRSTGLPATTTIPLPLKPPAPSHHPRPLAPILFKPTTAGLRLHLRDGAHKRQRGR